MQQAFDELGYVNLSFDDRLARALGRLVDVPVQEGDVMLRATSVTFQFADPELEALSPAQKHMLRMGPHNMRLVQTKLRAFARAAGLTQAGRGRRRPRRGGSAASSGSGRVGVSGCDARRRDRHRQRPAVPAERAAIVAVERGAYAAGVADAHHDGAIALERQMLAGRDLALDGPAAVDHHAHPHRPDRLERDVDGPHRRRRPGVGAAGAGAPRARPWRERLRAASRRRGLVAAAVRRFGADPGRGQ